MEKTNKEKLYDILKAPLVTEKSVAGVAQGKYTFEVSMDANKVDIAKAFEVAYPGRKVKKVSTAYMPSHDKRLGIKFGRTQSSKKAIITAEGDPIEELTGA